MRTIQLEATDVWPKDIVRILPVAAGCDRIMRMRA
jgi:hypothetical protein